MYEFLAPWGVLAPAFSAMIMYFIVKEKQRKIMLLYLDPPAEDMFVSRRGNRSGLA